MIKRVLRRIISSPLANKQKGLLFGYQARRAGLTLVAGDSYFDLEKDNRVLRLGSTHAVYLPDMIAHFDHYADSVIPVKEDSKQITNFNGQRYHRLTGFGDVPFLFPSLTEPYATTKEYLDFADLKPGQTVLDIGAYAGVTSIIFAQLVKPGRVYALEADATNYGCAKINVEMADKAMELSNITLINKAVWSHNNGILFSSEGAMGSSAVTFTGGGRGREIRVPSTTLESFVQENGLTHIDFIKMDIEGAETELLRHSGSFIHKLGAKMIIEPHKIKGKMNTGECCKLLESAGFSVRVRDQIGAPVPLIEATQ
jgi:FkbM family methyltransferase